MVDLSSQLWHWNEWLAEANWFMIYYLSIVHLGALVGFKFLFECHFTTLILLPIFLWLSGFGITAGAHRLWSHRSFKAHWSVRFFLMLCNSMANQGTIIHWVRDHRVHHKYSDTIADPHNSERGFFFAHMGWLLVRKHPKVIEAGHKLNFDDLWADWTVRLQQSLNPWGQFFMCFGFPAMVTMKLNPQESWQCALFVNGFLKYVLVLHATWLVNSAAHFYGYQPYDNQNPPRENPLVAFAAMGEGWHNWHHKFPFDYATSEFGVTQQFNPTKLLIDFWAWCGLVTERKRATDLWHKIQEKKLSSSCSSDPMTSNNGSCIQDLSGKKAKAT
jgi:stearoyl-CoA desaturase (delta-9 desaturase)